MFELFEMFELFPPGERGFITIQLQKKVFRLDRVYEGELRNPLTLNVGRPDNPRLCL